MGRDAQDEAKTQLEQLLGFLSHDPENANLLADAAEAALACSDLEEAARLLERCEAAQPASMAVLDLKGRILLAKGDYGAAAQLFDFLREERPNDPVLRYNLAWARGASGAFGDADDLLDDQTLASGAHAITLKVQMLHHLDRLKEALTLGRGALRQYPGDQPLAAATALAAFDAGDLSLARELANQAPSRHDAIAVSGQVALEEDQPETALELFDKALGLNPDSVRALFGAGLAHLALGRPEAAQRGLERAARIYGDDPVSWTALGWARLAHGDRPGAMAAFDEALAIDADSADAHAGLAMTGFLSGDFAAAEACAKAALKAAPDDQGASAILQLSQQARADPKGRERIAATAKAMAGEETSRMIKAALGAAPGQRGPKA